MKIWMKYLIGAVVGSILALVVPLEASSLREFFVFLFDLSIRIGRYALLPLVLCTVPVAVYELNEDKEFWSGLWKTILALLGGVVAFSAVGVVTAALFNTARIPLPTDTGTSVNLPGLKELLLETFPSDLFSVLVSDRFFLPLFFFATLLGLAFSHDRTSVKPVLQLFDSFSRIFYQINSFFSEFLGVLIIAASAQTVITLRGIPRIEVYRSLLLMIGIELALSVFVIVPALLYFFGGKKNPVRTLYALLAPAMAALVSGDIFFAMGSLMKHEKESLGVRRRSNGLVLPLAAIFGRAGTAMVASTAFIVVLSSYSSLGVSFSSFLWILATAPFVTLILGSAPGTGAMVALMSLCSLYGKGFENGFLIVMPVALPLVAAGALLDVLWAGAAALLVARKTMHAKEKEARFFI